MSQKQTLIIETAKQNGGKITTAQAVALLGREYYHNGQKYVSEILGRMAKSGALIRVKRGVYELPKLGGDQMSLFQ